MKNSKPGRKTKQPAKRASTAAKPRGNDGDVQSVSQNPDNADDSMTEALVAKCQAMHELEQKSNRQEIEVRYQMAQHCRDVVDGDGEGKSYGARAVETFALKIKWSKSQVYAYAKIVTVWTAEEVSGLEAQDHCTWAHLISLASDKVEDHRDKLIERVKEKGLSVRDLKREIARRAPPKLPKQADHTVDTSPSVSLVGALQDYTAKLAAFEADGKADAERLQHAVQEAGGEALTPAALQQMRQIRKRLNAVFARDTKVFDACIAKAEKAKKSTPKPAKDKPRVRRPVKKAQGAVKPAPKAAAEPKPKRGVRVPRFERSPFGDF